MEINKPKQLWQLRFEGEWPTTVAFLGDSRRIAAGNRSGEIVIWETPREAMPILELPMAERKEALRGILAKDWDRSVWTKRDIVQGDASKVHVVTTFVRLRKDGSEIAAYDSLYVMAYQDGRWAIKGRSSFAP